MKIQLKTTGIKLVRLEGKPKAKFLDGSHPHTLTPRLVERGKFGFNPRSPPPTKRFHRVDDPGVSR